MNDRASGNGLSVSPWITHERLDDEVMAINLESGAYIALDDAAADCWSLLVAGASVDEIARVLAERYTVDEAGARGSRGSRLRDRRPRSSCARSAAGRGPAPARRARGRSA